MSTLREDAAAALRATTRNADLRPDRMTPREIILTALEQLTVFNTKDQATDAIAAALTAAGYQIVLVEPTLEMGLAGAEQVNKHMRGPGAPADYDAAMDAYSAMLSASKSEEGA